VRGEGGGILGHAVALSVIGVLFGGGGTVAATPLGNAITGWGGIDGETIHCPVQLGGEEERKKVIKESSRQKAPENVPQGRSVNKV